MMKLIVALFFICCTFGEYSRLLLQGGGKGAGGCDPNVNCFASPCDSTTCAPGQICTNVNCGGSCKDDCGCAVCEPAPNCGPVNCPHNKVCCNALCGICTKPV